MTEMSSELLWAVILGMTLVTYVPRMAPLVALDAEKLPSRLVLYFLHL